MYDYNFLVFAKILPLVIFLFVWITSGIQENIDFPSSDIVSCIATWALFGFGYLFIVWLPCFLCGLVISTIGVHFGYGAATIIILVIFSILLLHIRKEYNENEMYEKMYYIDTYGDDWDLKYYKDKKAGLLK